MKNCGFTVRNTWEYDMFVVILSFFDDSTL